MTRRREKPHHIAPSGTRREVGANGTERPVAEETDLVRLPDAARMLGISPTTVRRLVAEGSVTAHRRTRGKGSREFVYVSLTALKAAYGATTPPEAGAGSQAIPRARRDAMAPPPVDLVAELRDRVSYLEHENANLRRDLDAARGELKDAHAELRQVNAELRAAFAPPKDGALVRWARSVKDAAAVFRGTR